MPSLVIFLSHSDPEGFQLDRVANLSDVAGVVRVVGLIRVVHREERRKITNICALPLLLFFG